MGDRSREIAWEIAWEIGLGVERLDCNLHGGLMAGDWTGEDWTVLSLILCWMRAVHKYSTFSCFNLSM